MSIHHLIRPEETVTICGISEGLVRHVLRTEEVQHPKKHDLILSAVKRAGGLKHVCQDCRNNRRFPWPQDHGQTEADEQADDDEHWKTLDAASREKMVDEGYPGSDLAWVEAPFDIDVDKDE